MDIEKRQLPAVTASTFDELIASTSVPVVIDFTAAWCPPCAPMTDALAQVVAEQGGRVAAATVDVDAEPELTRRFAVMSMPTLLVFFHGELVDRLVGARGPRHLLEDLGRHLPPAQPVSSDLAVRSGVLARRHR